MSESPARPRLTLDFGAWNYARGHLTRAAQRMTSAGRGGVRPLNAAERAAMEPCRTSFGHMLTARPTFNDIARGILSTFGVLACGAGLMGLFTAMGTNIAAPALIPTSAIVAGSILFFGGSALAIGLAVLDRLVFNKPLQAI